MNLRDFSTINIVGQSQDQTNDFFYGICILTNIINKEVIITKSLKPLVIFIIIES